ncbi:uncharacterized protein LOC125832037 [Solanum verrucosum]|uniref:uncharacterized protein LOC125832037 n=1 Tax=Solanum verrucosum TaxID=315347 RepID=UPI0020D1240D|nr:uncharacterized protein LOC125832037 [Solanum verrucosum]
MEKYFFKVSNSSSITQNQPNREENANYLEVPSHSSQEFDLSSLKADPEYSISKDAAFCLYCYLFKQNNNLQGGGETFLSVGFRSWHKKASLQTHVGGHTSIRNQSKIKCEDLMRQQQSIHASFEKQFNQDKHGYQIRLAASIDVVRLLVKQGLAFRGHYESKLSLNRGNFLAILSFYAQKCDEVRKFVLENALQNDQMTCPKIQKDIVIACKIETIKGIIKELNGDYFSLLVDESFDVSRKEQMAVVLRYVDRRGFVMERLLDIVHVKNTSALSLKEAIVNLLSQHSLSLSYVRGPCYDGASNMQGDINGFKMLIKKESRSAYSIHCFAHQLQLTLVGVSKRCLQVGEFVHLVSNIFNVLAASYKRMDDYRESQKKKIKKLLIWQLQELNDRFDEVTTELLYGAACLNPVDSFSSFDIQKIMRMVELYPDNFDELSILVQTKKHSCYPLVFHLVKFVLLLPVATASVERAFSGMKFIKNELRSRMNDDFLSGCMVPFMEKDVFQDVSTDAIILSFQAMKPRRIVL